MRSYHFEGTIVKTEKSSKSTHDNPMAYLSRFSTPKARKNFTTRGYKGAMLFGSLST